MVDEQTYVRFSSGSPDRRARRGPLTRRDRSGLDVAMRSLSKDSPIVQEPGELLVEHRGRVRWVPLNRPHRLNAFTWDLRDRLLAALTVAPGDDLDAIVLTGAGRGFCAGVDLDVLRDGARGPPPARRADLERAQQIVQLMSGAPCPVVAAVNGVAAGGGWGL